MCISLASFYEYVKINSSCGLQQDDNTGITSSTCRWALWVNVSLVNGAMRTVQAICYRTGGPPDLPIAIMVRLDSYSGPTFPDSTLHFTTAGGSLHSAHDSSCPSNWCGPSQYTNHRVSPATRWSLMLPRESSPLASYLLPALVFVSCKTCSSLHHSHINTSPIYLTVVV